MELKGLDADQPHIVPIDVLSRAVPLAWFHPLRARSRVCRSYRLRPQCRSSIAAHRSRNGVAAYRTAPLSVPLPVILSTASLACVLSLSFSQLFGLIALNELVRLDRAHRILFEVGPHQFVALFGPFPLVLSACASLSCVLSCSLSLSLARALSISISARSSYPSPALKAAALKSVLIDVRSAPL